MDATQPLLRSPDLSGKYAVMLSFSDVLIKGFNQFYHKTLTICDSESCVELAAGERERTLVAEYTTLRKMFHKQYEIFIGPLLKSDNMYAASSSHAFFIPGTSPLSQRQYWEVYLKARETQGRQAHIIMQQASSSAIVFANQSLTFPVDPKKVDCLLKTSPSLKKLIPLIEALELIIHKMKAFNFNYTIESANFQVFKDSLGVIGELLTFFMIHNEGNYLDHLMQIIPPVLESQPQAATPQAHISSQRSSSIMTIGSILSTD